MKGNAMTRMAAPSGRGRVFMRGGLAALVLVVLLADLASACPTCKENLANSGPDAINLIRGYFWSIIFMMSMPFLILGSLAGYFYYEVRKARHRQAAVPSLTVSTSPMNSW